MGHYSMNVFHKTLVVFLNNGFPFRVGGMDRMGWISRQGEV